MALKRSTCQMKQRRINEVERLQNDGSAGRPGFDGIEFLIASIEAKAFEVEISQC
jgi:hypothetical protein